MTECVSVDGFVHGLRQREAEDACNPEHHERPVDFRDIDLTPHNLGGVDYLHPGEALEGHRLRNHREGAWTKDGFYVVI